MAIVCGQDLSEIGFWCASELLLCLSRAVVDDIEVYADVSCFLQLRQGATADSRWDNEV